ncbi:hypothetical protein PHAVU_011G186000 [Phaseolus vulgaris]|uniref:Knottin scorpion toxin-like domain-containing protein n=1 Tax=Phaseolus vulgaris TaxID=3885 RepID=V7AIY1_PHAVU|nr:hypothetical protein PHAVU_011G186000g [Phaseolus vulgaris]ESW05514.1 hypothetical protein PHAVU_011G186000g [Phaseolus vulgaris]
MKIIFSLLIIMLLSIGMENKGPMKVVEGKMCEMFLYNYCDENCYSDCPKWYGPKTIGVCIEKVCKCRYECT